MSQNSPIILGANIATAFATNSIVTVDPTICVNPNRTPMLVDQIRFGFPRTHNDALTASTDLWRQLSLDLRVGDIPITNGYVPFPAMIPMFDTGGDPRHCLVWHLPKPLYVPPGLPVFASIRRDLFVSGETPSGTFDMDIGYACRSLPAETPVPPRMFIPWVTGFRIDANTTLLSGTSNSTFLSGDSQLGNPHNTPFRMKRIFGWKIAGTTTSSADVTQDMGTFLSVQMTLSNGKMLVRDPVLLSNLFPYGRGYFDVDGVLQPKEFVRLRAELTASASITNIYPAAFGVTGYRVVDTPQRLNRSDVFPAPRLPIPGLPNLPGYTPWRKP